MKNGITVKTHKNGVILTIPLHPDVVIPLASEEATELGGMLTRAAIVANSYKPEEPLTEEEAIISVDDTLYIYTDGACSGNPGPGASAYLIKDDAGDEVSKGVKVIDTETTNQRTELGAAILALQDVYKKGINGCRIVLYSDSEYLVNGITKWLDGWKQKGWKTASKKPVSNTDLWTKLDKFNHLYPITWVWVKGHDGHPENELVDKMAQDACPKIKR